MNLAQRLGAFMFQDQRELMLRSQRAPRLRRVFPAQVVRAHQAAKISRLTQELPTAPTSIDQVVYTDLHKLRARSRWEAENDDYAMRWLALVETNVIGDVGIRPFPRVTFGKDDQPDVAMNEAISRAWEEWSTDKSACDMGGKHTWHDLERLFIRTTAEDGEALFQEVRGAAAGRFGYALHPIDAELLDTLKEQEVRGGTFIRLGVECNEWGRPVAYWIKDGGNVQGHAGLWTSYFGRNSKPYAAADMIHEFIARRIGQKRGLPWASSSLFRMRQLAGFEDAAAVAARAGAAQMGAIERPDAAGDGEAPYDDEEGEGGPRIIETEPGVFMELGPGEKLANYTPNYPHEQFESFVKTALRGVAAGLNVSYNALANDLEKVNYSSMRAGRQDDNDAWRLLQGWTCAHFHKRVYRGFLEMAALTGTLRPVDGRQVSVADAQRMAEMVDWRPRGWEPVDPMKGATANLLEIKEGLRSRSEIIIERGGNPNRVWQELVNEEKFLQEAGVLKPMDQEATVQAVKRALEELQEEAEERDDDEERDE